LLLLLELLLLLRLVLCLGLPPYCSVHPVILCCGTSESPPKCNIHNSKVKLAAALVLQLYASVHQRQTGLHQLPLSYPAAAVTAAAAAIAATAATAAVTAAATAVTTGAVTATAVREQHRTSMQTRHLAS
jgi:hypothetical protein